MLGYKVSTFDKFPIITLLNSPLYGWWSFVKYSLDYLFSIGFLILLSPILFIVSLAVWMTDFKAPIFLTIRPSPRIMAGLVNTAGDTLDAEAMCHFKKQKSAKLILEGGIR